MATSTKNEAVHIFEGRTSYLQTKVCDLEKRIVFLVFVGLAYFFSTSLKAQPVKVLSLIPTKFCETYYYNTDHMETFGWELTTAGAIHTLQPDPAYGGYLGCPAINAEYLASEVDIAQYQVLVVQMGVPWSGPTCQDLLSSTNALQLIRAAVDSGLVVVGMSTGTRVLAAANVINGKRVTGWNTFQSEYQNAGATYIDWSVPPVIDGQIVTTGEAGDYYHFQNNEAIACALSKMPVRSTKLPLSNLQVINQEAMGNLWVKTIGGNLAEGGYHILYTSDGNLLLCGYTYSSGQGDSDVLLVKADTSGNIIWSETIGGNKRDVANCVVENPGDGFYLAGHTYSYGNGQSDLWLLKVNLEGQTEWQKTFGGSASETGKSLIITDDDELVILGYAQTDSVNDDDFFLVKTRLDGSLVWQKYYAGDEKSDMGFGICQKSNGNYSMIGATGYFNGTGIGDCNRDMMFLETDTAGTVLRTKKINYANSGHSNQQFGISIVNTPDNGFLFAGLTDVYYQDLLQMYLVKADSNGNTQWSRRYGQGFGYDYVNQCIAGIDQSYLLCGTTRSFPENHNDLYFIEISPNGQKIREVVYGGIKNEKGASVCQSPDGSVYLLGQTNSMGAGSFDLLLVKIPPLFSSIRNIETDFSAKFHIFISEPGHLLLAFETETKGLVNLSITSVNGIVVWSGGPMQVLPGRNTWEISLNETPGRGFFICHLRFNNQFFTKKIVF